VLPARSLAVSVIWLVAPHGATPPQVTVLVDWAKVMLLVCRVRALSVPSLPGSVAVEELRAQTWAVEPLAIPTKSLPLKEAIRISCPATSAPGPR